jgi:hypothetical protein
MLLGEGVMKYKKDREKKKGLGSLDRERERKTEK